MRERVHTFGEHGNLVGIHTEATPCDRDRPTLVFLTAGLLHRVGPNRLYVELARDLAASGYPGFRFDMTGVGDSGAIADVPGVLDRYAGDVREALDFLATEYGAREFVLLGLCSGADYSHIGAVADARVAGAVLLDGYGYPTREYKLRKLAPKLASPRTIAGYLRRRARSLANRPTVHPPALDVFARVFPPREQVARELASLVARGSKLYFIYSGGQPYVNYREQLRDMFPEVDTRSFQVDFFPDADHTFLLRTDRDEIRRRVRGWLLGELPGPRRPTRPPEPASEREAGDDDDTEDFVF